MYHPWLFILCVVLTGTALAYSIVVLSLYIGAWALISIPAALALWVLAAGFISDWIEGR